MADDPEMGERKGPRSQVPARRPTGGQDSRWPEYVQFLFVVCLTVIFLLLAVSMKRHHFLRGELYQQSHPFEH